MITPGRRLLELDRFDLEVGFGEDNGAEPPDHVSFDRGAKHTGFLIVRLEEPGRNNRSKTLHEFAREQNLVDLAEVLDQFDLHQSQRLVGSVAPREIVELETRAAMSELPPLRSLTSYWKIDMRGDARRLEKALKVLRRTPGVAAAYPELVGDDPLVNAADDTYNAQQNYLDAAPDGIDARWAWTQPNGEGAGVGVIDMEQGWFLTHEDYTSKAPPIVVGDNRDGVGSYVGNHGTAVLGEMIADDNDRGVVGIAPAAGPVACASHYDSTTNTTGNVADAVLGAITNLSAGDALVIEYQTNFLPAEVVDDSFDAIRLASAVGIMVFEAAGNGSMNLDLIVDAASNQVLNRTSPGFRESGAIMVGAGVDTVPHERAGFSNFGSRIDCYGWGQNVVTCGYGTLDNGGGDNDQTYADGFGGTSSATPIVTGAGLVVQGMHEANTGARLSPMQMRALLSDPSTGTPQGPNVAGNIGVMPDLRAIIEDTLGLTADAYIRDNVGDTGAVPTSGGISASPDIIVRPFELADPDSAFGEGSGHENTSTLGFEVEAGQDNFLYCRMRNRGATVAENAAVDLYWSEVATLVTPDMWNPIGTTTPVDIPVGDTLVVTDAVTWPAASIPGTGHYCFVGVLDSDGDTAPLIPPPTDWAGFTNFIRNQNNVAWRNFNVVDDIGDPDADPSILPFLIANAPDRHRVFDLVIEQRLAEGVRVTLEIPLELIKPFASGLDLEMDIDRKRGVGRVMLPWSQRLTVRNVRLSARARLQSRFIVEGVAHEVRPGNQLSIGQYHEDLEVGRVTWHFSKKRNPERPC